MEVLSTGPPQKTDVSHNQESRSRNEEVDLRLLVVSHENCSNVGHGSKETLKKIKPKHPTNRFACPVWSCVEEEDEPGGEDALHPNFSEPRISLSAS